MKCGRQLTGSALRGVGVSEVPPMDAGNLSANCSSWAKGKENHSHGVWMIELKGRVKRKSEPAPKLKEELPPKKITSALEDGLHLGQNSLAVVQQLL